MSRGVFNLKMMGGFGNQLFQYAFARAYCLQNDLELRTQQWVGQRIFKLSDPPIRDALPRVAESSIVPGLKNFECEGYFQNQKSLIYSRRDAKEWFLFSPAVELPLSEVLEDSHSRLVAHRRVIGYAEAGYPVCSTESYLTAAFNFGYNQDKLAFVSDESPGLHSWFASELSFLPDFARLMAAPVLLRANSSFSWWAATLGNGVVFSPVIDGLEGGKEHDVKFVAGNHPRLANLEFVTDLHLKP